MSSETPEAPARPSLLATMLLMFAVGGVLVGFFFFLQSFQKDSAKPKADPETVKRQQEETARAVEEANRIRKNQPAAQDPAEAAHTRQVLAETSPRRPFSTEPDGQTTGSQQSGMAPARALPADGLTPPPSIRAAEAVKEFAVNSSEGQALLKDASARVDEAPDDLYSDKAKSRVREGLSQAKRIFKVYTVSFENGGASPTSKDKASLEEALKQADLATAMEDPRSVFFVLGFADKSGNEDSNKKISRDRANAVIETLKDIGTLNLTYPVAVGATELVAPENQNKNRAAEVWLVLP